MTKQILSKYIVLGIVVAAFLGFMRYGDTLRSELIQIGQKPIQAPARPSPYPPAGKYPSPTPQARPGTPAPAQVPTILPTMLIGKWQGGGMTTTNYSLIGIEVRPIAGDPNHLSGYASYTSISRNPVARIAKPGTDAQIILNQTVPHHAMLTGTLEADSVTFTVDRIIGPDDKCPLTELKLTRFGTSGFVADWKYGGSCPAGQAMLGRAGL